MRRFLISLTSLGLLSTAASAQPAPTEPSPPADAEPEPAPAPPVTSPSAATAPVATPEPAPPPAEPAAKPDKGFFIKSDDGKYSLQITGRVQPFYNITRSATANAADPDDDIVDYRHQFEVRRARLTLDGKLHGKALTYKLHAGFDRGAASIKDAHLDVNLATDVWLRFGQWKRPFSRQQIASSQRLELPDRSITDRAFGAGRDVGVALRNNYEKSPDLEWTVGLFNGTGDATRLSGTVMVDPMTGVGTIGPTTNTNVPTKFKPALVARIGINRNGIDGYAEPDLVGGPLRFGVGASVWLEGDFDDNDESNQKIELDYIVKVSGFSTSGAVYAMTAQTDEKLADAELSLVGFHVQGGYMLAKQWQAALRYAAVNDPGQKAVAATDQQELSLGVTYFGYGHDAKLVGGVRLLKVADNSFTDVILFELGSNINW